MFLQDTDKTEVLQFKTQEVQACLEIKYIYKALQLTMLKAVSNCPSYFLGLLNLAGESVPIIDLGILIGQTKNKKYSLSTPIIICQFKESKVGILVDEIIGLAKFDNADIQMNEKLNKEQSPYLGTVAIDNNLILIMDITYIFNAEIVTIGTLS